MVLVLLNCPIDAGPLTPFRFQLILEDVEGGAIFNPNHDGTHERRGAPMLFFS